ncbi:MAG: endopeptidase La [Thermoanaerobaculia bacterium]
MSEPALQPPVESAKLPDIMPVLPLKDVVTYPFIILPLSIGREKSVRAVDQALAEHRVLMLLTQSSPLLDDPGEDDLPRFGTAATIMRMLKLPDGRLRILVQGVSRARVEHFSQSEPFLLAKVRPVEEQLPEESRLEIQALVRSVKENLDHAVNLGKSISPEVMIIAANLEDPGRLADLAASNLELEVGEAQQILETTSPFARLQRVSELLQREVQLLTMQQEISMQARGEMDKNQREFFLRQQLKTIQEELGEGEELASEIAAYRQRARERGLTDEALEELERQIRRLERGHPDSAESSVTRTYLDWLTGLPWSLRSEDHLDLKHARRVLDEDHYDLDKVKQRIIEYLAVRKLNPESKGPILCFVGPPGVGKTSLGRSIARALGRKFVRLSLGGIRDEAEIRGHRRTYVGALPGRILQGLHQAGTGNPVFMIDEIDKIGTDFRGDPSSALLEVLDPEQNSTFRDHYIGAAYDLSQVLFITTANLLDPIQPAFLDRMEVIRLSGYTAGEKQKIARRHLIPKQLAEHGLSRRQLSFTDAAVRRIIVDYTKEAGLRNLERELAAVCRKVAVKVADGDDSPTSVTLPRVAELLGPARHFSEELLSRDRVGVATGLAWTAVGGDLLFIEVLSVAGKGELVLTGQLGQVMKESAQAALSFARSRTGNEVSPEFFTQNDLHIHVPAGSVPKDGPSAGITIAAAIVSVLKGLPVDRRVAMTGEITLRGEVLPIGGIKEKVLAARAAGVRGVILPRLNRRDFAELAPDLTKGLTVHYVDHMDEVLEIALPGFARAPRRRPRPATS